MENSIQYEAQLSNFVKKMPKDAQICLITSGGTSVKLEKNTVRTVENFSTGKRGSLCCEEFLKNGYYVIFLYRAKSEKPFLNHLKLEE